MRKKTLITSILLLALTLVAGCASLTGARSCTCEHNAQTGVTKWECESGAISEEASIQFDEQCGFNASAQGAQPGPGVETRVILDAMANALLGQRLPDPGQ